MKKSHAGLELKSTVFRRAYEKARCVPGFYSFKKGGFTLIELLAVMVIIALLVGIGATGYHLVRQSARESQTLAGLEQLHHVLNDFRVEFGRYPASGETEFQLLASGLPNRQREFLERRSTGLVLNDSWGRPFRYSCDDRYLFELWSIGVDPENPDDDISLQKKGI